MTGGKPLENFVHAAQYFDDRVEKYHSQGSVYSQHLLADISTEQFNIYDAKPHDKTFIKSVLKAIY